MNPEAKPLVDVKQVKAEPKQAAKPATHAS
jgi:hypothetical protein